VNCIAKEEHRIYYEYRIVNDLNNLESTAYQIAAFVSMWGRIILHKKLLREHGMRALYCDTDSAIIRTRGGIDTVKWTGKGLGDLTNEVPKQAPRHFKNPFIKEVVPLAPKTYGLKIVCGETGEIYYKVVCKGFEPSYSNSKHIHFQAFKELVFTQYNLNAFMNHKRATEEFDVEERYKIRGERRLHFGSSLARNNITPVESYSDKSITGQYTKGKVHPYDPRFISPFSKVGILPPKENFLTDREKHFE
jgi:hypothetical protein